MNYGLEVAGGKDANGTNVQIAAINDDASQMFTLTKYVDEDGVLTYSITPYCAKSRRLDVYGAQKANFTNVWIYNSNDTAAQRWIFTKGATEDSYVIHSALSDEVKDCALDIYCGTIADGNNVTIYESNGTLAQDWTLVPADLPIALTDGSYSIKSCKDGTVLDFSCGSVASGTEIKTTVGTGSDYTQIFDVKQIDGSGYSKVQSSSLGTVLDVYGAEKKSGAKVWAYSYNASLAQQWELINTGETDGDGNFKYLIKTRLGNYYLMNNNQTVTTTADKTLEEAKWVLTATKMKDPTVETGKYVILPVGNTSKGFDISAASTASCAPIQLYTRNDTCAQKFEVTKSGDYYKLMALNSGLYMNCYGGGSGENGQKVIQYSDDGTNACKWRLVSTGDPDGSFYIYYYDTNYCVDVPAAQYNNGTQMQIYTANGTTAQKFIFVPTKITKLGWQNYLGKYRYLKSSDGTYARNEYVTGPEGDRIWVGDDGTITPQWVVKNGYYRYMTSNGSYVNDVRPYLSSLFGTKTVQTYIQGQGYHNVTVPNCSYHITVDRARCLVTVYTKYKGTNDWNLPVCAFSCSPGTDATPTDAGNWTTCQLAGIWSVLMGPSYGQYALRIHDSELFHSVACDRCNRENLDPGTYNALGTKQSHGCVRLDVRNAYWLYYFVGLNTGVYVGDYLAAPLTNVPQPRMYADGCIDPTDVYYTGNYGYTDSNVYYGRYFF